MFIGLSSVFLFQFVILFVGNLLQPFVGSTLLRYAECDMLEPAVACRAVPVFDFRRYLNHVTRLKFTRLLAPFLIPSASADTYQYLSTLVMNVPVVAATWLERYIC